MQLRLPGMKKGACIFGCQLLHFCPPPSQKTKQNKTKQKNKKQNKTKQTKA